MKPDENDLSDAPPELQADPLPPPKPRRAPVTLDAQPVQSAQRPKLRGVGEAKYHREPVAAVVEVLKRAPPREGEKAWRILPPFCGTVEGAKWAFAIMTPTTTTTRAAGSRTNPARAPHPDFAAFNECNPDLACTIRARLVHWTEEECFPFHLGCYQAPKGHAGPKDGWFCRGDGKKAYRRGADGIEKQIVCPGEMCEFSQPDPNMRGQKPCKPHIAFLGQFFWKEGSPLPRVMFQWSSQSWNGWQNAKGMFDHVQKMASNLGCVNFPVFGLPVILNLKETIKAKKGQRYPEVHFAVDGDIMGWISGLRGMIAAGQAGPQLSAPPEMAQLPPPGMTQTDVERAEIARLDPNYRPSNER